MRLWWNPLGARPCRRWPGPPARGNRLGGAEQATGLFGGTPAYGKSTRVASVPITLRLDAFKEGNSQRCCPGMDLFLHKRTVADFRRRERELGMLETKPPKVQLRC